MARPPANKKPLPNPSGMPDDIGDLIEEALFDILKKPQQVQTRPRSASEQSRAKTPRSRVTGSSLSPSTNKNKGNCCNCCNDMLGMLSIINDSVFKMLDALKAEHLLDKKKADQIKKDQEQRERREKENLLESSGRKLSNTFKQALAPIKSAFDAVLRFITFTLLGRVVGKVLKWFADPANKKKVKSLTRFLKDWWPALLGAFVLFGTNFGAAIRATVKTLVSTVLYLKKIGIPGILAGLKSFGKKGAVAALVAGTAIGGMYLFNKVMGSDEEEKTSTSKNSPTQARFNGGLIPRMNFFGPQNVPIDSLRYQEGGHIDEHSGLSITGAGPDTQLIAAQPGEIVISKAAVDKFGADTFLRMNKMAGATNQPRMVNNIQLAQQGGVVGVMNKMAGVTNQPRGEVGGLMNSLRQMGSNVIKGLNIMSPILNKPAKATNSYAAPKGPAISKADYNALLAIASAEDSDPQGRADVAQSIYNRLRNTSSFGENYLPTGGRNTIKDIITGKGQYQPTFKNSGDWLGIKDRQSAAIALSRAKGLDFQRALQLLSETEKAIRDPQLQMNAQMHVKGSPNFYGKSQREFMQPGDRLRTETINGKKTYRDDNYFTRVDKPQQDTPAPIPMNLLKLSSAPMIQPPGPKRAGQVTIAELPPIDLRNTKANLTQDKATPEVPEFSATAPDYYSGRTKKINQLGIVA